MSTEYIVRYGEIALKSPAVRKFFTDRLVDNIKDIFIENQTDFFIERGQGRLWVKASSENAPELLKRVFGIVSFSLAEKISSEMEDVYATSVAMSRKFPEKSSFAVRCRRSGVHKYSSMELAGKTGEQILEQRPDLTVNLTRPDNELCIEVRNNQAWIFTETIYGPGGMPYNTQGRILCFYQHESDISGAWMMMKRGCAVDIVVDDESDDFKIMIEAIKKWVPSIRVFTLVEVEERIRDIEEKNKELPGKDKKIWHGIVSGTSSIEKIKQLNSLKIVKDNHFPVFTPLIGFDESEIKKLNNIVMLY